MSHQFCIWVHCAVLSLTRISWLGSGSFLAKGVPNVSGAAAVLRAAHLTVEVKTRCRIMIRLAHLSAASGGKALQDCHCLNIYGKRRVMQALGLFSKTEPELARCAELPFSEVSFIQNYSVSDRTGQEKKREGGRKGDERRGITIQGNSLITTAEQK